MSGSAEASVLTIGLACVICAVVAGGLEMASITFPVISSVRRQVLLGLLGVALVVWSQTGLKATPASSHDPVVNAPDHGSVLAYSGPSTHGYTVRKNVASGESVHLTCAAYGEPLRLPGVADALWDYTSAGWLNDHYLVTGGAGPFAPGCLGNVAAPRAGGGAPSPTAGPFPVITDEGVTLAVRRTADPSSPTVGTLRNGDLVVLTCHVRGVLVPAPRALGPGASNDQWDRIVLPAGFIPDSQVNSHTPLSPAPAC